MVVTMVPSRYHNSSSEFRISGRYAYDGHRQRKWTLEERSTDDGNTTGVYEILELHEERKAYVTERSTGKCTIYNLSHPFRHHDISNNATFVGYETYGVRAGGDFWMSSSISALPISPIARSFPDTVDVLCRFTLISTN
jgi:hypothetical protein